MERILVCFYVGDDRIIATFHDNEETIEEDAKPDLISWMNCPNQKKLMKLYSEGIRTIYRGKANIKDEEVIKELKEHFNLTFIE